MNKKTNDKMNKKKKFVWPTFITTTFVPINLDKLAWLR